MQSFILQHSAINESRTVLTLNGDYFAVEHSRFGLSSKKQFASWEAEMDGM